MHLLKLEFILDTVSVTIVQRAPLMHQPRVAFDNWGANPKVTGRVLMQINGCTVFELGKSISFHMDSMDDDPSSSNVIIGEMKRMRKTSDTFFAHL
jgi:hypothetical protein